MNYEGLINNYPINVVRPYENISTGTRVVLPNTPDKATLNGNLDKYLDRNTMLAIIYSNPEITRILSEKGVPVNINIDSFKKNVYNHSVDTKKTALGIYNNLPDNLKSQANIKDISDGAILHDIGKILIPENILTKQYKLNPREEDIMHLHSTLSNEILKNQNFNNNVLDIVKYHHQNPSHTGYPDIGESKKINLDAQIVSVADKYSALREKRSYKPQMSETEALNILYNELNKGVSPDVYRALSKYALSKNNNVQNTTTLSNYLNMQQNLPPYINRNTPYYA